MHKILNKILSKHLYFVVLVFPRKKVSNQTPFSRRCVCLGRMKSLILSLSPVRARASALSQCLPSHTRTHYPSLFFSPFFPRAPAFYPVPSHFLFISGSQSLSLRSHKHGTRTHAMNTCDAPAHSHLQNMQNVCELHMCLCLYLVACRGIAILLRSAGAMWMGFWACNRSPLSHARTLSHLSIVYPLMDKGWVMEPYGCTNPR